MSDAFLDSAPPTWERVPLWTIAQRRERRGMPDAERLSVYRDHGVVPTASREDNFNKAGEDLSAYKLVSPGDLVLNKMKTWQGSLAVSEHAGIVSPAYFVLTLDERVHPRWIHHLLRSQPYIAQYAALSKGIRPNQWDLPFEELRRIAVLLPPLDEQRRIADFLDTETARLDRLSSATSAQMALLRARYLEWLRQVTTGSECDPTQPTGVPWMPVVSAAWRLHKVSRVFTTGSGTTPLASDPTYFDGPHAWINTGDLRDVPVVAATRTVTDKALESYSGLAIYPAGSLLIAMYGATIGRTGLLRVPATVNQACCVLHRATAVSTEFAWHWFIAHRPWILTLAAGAGQPNISQDVIRSLVIPAPDLDHQREIVTFIGREAARTAASEAALVRRLRLIAERRQALITAAVTGRVDVTTAQRATVSP